MRFVENGPPTGPGVLFLHGGNVAGWIWREQTAALSEHHSIVPDMPGFAASRDERWTDVATVTDELAELIRSKATDGRAHIVGLSLGGIVATVLAARHPGVMRSVMVSGAATRPVNRFARFQRTAQLRLWGSRRYWEGVARAYRLPADSVEEFVSTGLGIDRRSIRQIMDEIYDGIPDATLNRLASLDAPLLAIAGEHDHRSIRTAALDIAGRAPHATAVCAPGMHHIWIAEDPELFHRALSHWLAHAEPLPELLPCQA